MPRRRKRKQAKPRNPLAPVVRKLRSRIKPSAKTYSRKGKRRRATAPDEPPRGADA